MNAFERWVVRTSWPKYMTIVLLISTGIAVGVGALAERCGHPPQGDTQNVAPTRQGGDVAGIADAGCGCAPVSQLTEKSTIQRNGDALTQTKAETKPKQLLAPKPSGETYLPTDVGPGDFFRMRREAQGWIVEMVRTDGDKVLFKRDVWAWDIRGNVENRLMTLAQEAEKRR